MRILTLGESMIRLSTDPGILLSNAISLNLQVGGAEANVAINLSQLGYNVSYATKVPLDNPWTLRLERQLDSFRINREHLLYDEGRMGSYFFEKGSGLRAGRVIYDREGSIIAKMTEVEWDLDRLFEGVDLLHITGITCALSPSWQKIGVEIITGAKARGVQVSFDMNYRQTMWTYEEAIAAYEKILPCVDILSANRLDAIHFMGIPDREDTDWPYFAQKIAEKYPNIQYLYGTNRESITPNTYRYSGHLYSRKLNQSVTSKCYELEEVADRIGAGDSYASAIIDGIVNERPLQEIVEFATAASVLKHTIEGDINLFNRTDIESFMSNSTNIVR